MKTEAAVLWGVGQDWSVEEIDLDDPGLGEVQIKLAATGLCHSDEHLVTGDLPGEIPIVGGHEGAGIVEKVGPDVSYVKPGDHVVLSFLPSCGRCEMCAQGKSNLCDAGATVLYGAPKRRHARGQDLAAMCAVGTFSPYVTASQDSVVKIRDDVPLDKAALVGCGVTTGWGSAVNVAEVQPGETVLVVGIGGIGINAVQGAAAAGARYVVAVDPVAFKREQALQFGATHTASDLAEAATLIQDITWGRLADKSIITMGVVDGQLIEPIMQMTRKGGRAVVTGLAPMMANDVKLNLATLTLSQKQLVGSLFGGANPRFDIPRILDYYKNGQIKLDELVTRTYKLNDINQGYQDMRDGVNLRGVVVF